METKTVTLKDVVPESLNPPANCIHITDEAGLEQVREFLSRTQVFGLDIETNVVDDFYMRRIRTLQVGDKTVQYVIDFLPFAQRAGVTLMDGMGGYRYHPCFQSIVDAVRPALESKTHLKVGHNLSFEYETLKFNLGLRIWNLYDTMLAEKVIYAGAVSFDISGFWALDDLVARYCKLRVEKKYQTSFDLENELTHEQVVYAGLDTRWPLACKVGQRDAITKGNLWRTVQLENDAIPAFSDIFLNGMLIDEDAWLSIVHDTESKIAACVERLDEFFVPSVGAKALMCEEKLKSMEQQWRTCFDKEQRATYRKAYLAYNRSYKEALKNFDTYEGEAAINYGSNPQLHKALLSMGFSKKELPNTDDKALKALKSRPVIDALREYRKYKKMFTTYGYAWITAGTFVEKGTRKKKQGYRHPITGRIHSRLIQMGAETGRTSSREPNCQNIPKDKRFRSAFVARPGYKILTIDFNGCELRILTEYSREPSWLNAFLNDWDVHSVGAEILFGQEWKDAAEPDCAYIRAHQKCNCPKHKDMRDRVKALNFGIAYGLEHKSLSEQLGISEDEALRLLTLYRKSFPVLMKYLEASGKFAGTHMEARTLAQRRRTFLRPTWETAIVRATNKLKKKKIERLPTTKEITQAYKGMFAAIEREGKNTPIQGSNADIIKVAMGCGFDNSGVGFLWHRLETDFHGLLINCVHDELVIEVPDEYAEACFKFASDCMTRGGAEFVKSIPMTTDGHIDVKWRK